MADFKIKVVRSGDRGRLTFSNGATTVDTECWWDPGVVVDAGTYTGYATRMSKKKDGRDGAKREGIWFGGPAGAAKGSGIPVNGNARKAKEIFIHKGKNASWSDGCIVCRESDVLRIWDAIAPKEQANVDIEIVDEVAVHPGPRGCRLY